MVDKYSKIFKLEANIEFEPSHISKKHARQGEWKKVVILTTGCDIHKYYSWFLQSRFDLKLNSPVRGTHLTIVSDRVDSDLWESAKHKYDSKKMSFYYENILRSNGEHWWLRAWSPEAERLRSIMGLERDPFYSFHVTIGNTNPKTQEFSEYILAQCKKFELLPNSTRIHYNEKQLESMI